MMIVPYEITETPAVAGRHWYRPGEGRDPEEVALLRPAADADEPEPDFCGINFRSVCEGGQRFRQRARKKFRAFTQPLRALLRVKRSNGRLLNARQDETAITRLDEAEAREMPTDAVFEQRVRRARVHVLLLLAGFRLAMKFFRHFPIPRPHLSVYGYNREARFS